jgi:hypothetical protein
VESVACTYRSKAGSGAAGTLELCSNTESELTRQYASMLTHCSMAMRFERGRTCVSRLSHTAFGLSAADDTTGFSKMVGIAQKTSFIVHHVPRDGDSWALSVDESLLVADGDDDMDNDAD